MIPPELIEIYQPVIGFEAVAVWINLFHSLNNGFAVTENGIVQQMNITQRNFRTSLKTLNRYGLLRQDNKDYTVVPPTINGLLAQLKQNVFPYELERRFIILLEAFSLERGQAPGRIESAAATESDQPNQVTEQLADEFATRFINECQFIPSRQLHDRFDLWFAEITDRRLLEELLTRTRHKVAMEGSKGGCPSRYTDKIVRQWLVQGIKNYEDLLRLDQEFQARCQFYRVVERELGRGFNTLTPAEKEIVDKWSSQTDCPDELAALIKKAILSGEYQGKGAPGVDFLDKWFDRQTTQPKAKAAKSGGFTHQHKLSDLEKAVQSKTMVGLEDGSHE